MSKRPYTLLEYLVALENNLKDLKKNVEDNIGTDFSEIVNQTNNLKEQFEHIASEIVQARGEEVNLNARLTKFDSQLDNIVKDMESESLELSTYGKQVISQAITNKGVPTTNSDSFKKMADNIGLIDGGGVKQQPIYETINGQLYRVILNEDFSKKNYLDKNIFADRYGINSWAKDNEIARANYKIENGCLKLFLTEDSEIWATDSSQMVSGISTCTRNGLHPNTDDRLALCNSKTPYRTFTEKFMGLIMQYGRIEICCKIPKGKEHLCAFWLIGIQDKLTEGYEIDVFENSTGRSDFISASAFHKNTSDIGISGSFNKEGLTSISENFHTYTVDWDNTGISIYVDGEYVGKNLSDVTYPMFVLLDHYRVPTGGWWGSNGESAILPCSFDIKYIKAWKKATSNQSALSIISQEVQSFTIDKWNDNLINEYSELKDCPTFIRLNWNDGSVSEHWVKWNRISTNLINKFKKAGTYTLKGVIQGLEYTFEPSLTINITNDCIASPSTPPSSKTVFSFDFTNIPQGTTEITANDESGFTATLVGGTIEEDGILLDGIDDYIKVNAQPFLNGIDNFTLEAELEVDSVQNNAYATFIECTRKTSPYGGFSIRRYNTDNGVTHCTFTNGNSPFSQDNAVSGDLRVTPNINAYPTKSVKLTKTSRGVITLAVDGNESSKTTLNDLTSIPTTLDKYLYVGCSNSDENVNSRFTKMKIKSLKFYDSII